MTREQAMAQLAEATWLHRSEARPRSSPAMRRLLDLFVASAALLCLLPVLLCIVIAIYMEDGSPLFFAQTRLGVGGKHFRLFKFRKFGSTAGVGLPVTLSDDPRLTRVGSMLEKTKLDEIPQFWNVIKGDMSIVGPRPESLHFADCFTGPFRALLDHKPGIFGPAQVRFRNESAYYKSGEDPELIYRRILFPTKASIDLQYYEHRTLAQDIGWMARGAAAVFGLSRGRPREDRTRTGDGDLFNRRQAGLENLQFTPGIGISSMARDE